MRARTTLRRPVIPLLIAALAASVVPILATTAPASAATTAPAAAPAEGGAGVQALIVGLESTVAVDTAYPTDDDKLIYLGDADHTDLTALHDQLRDRRYKVTAKITQCDPGRTYHWFLAGTTVDQPSTGAGADVVSHGCDKAVFTGIAPGKRNLSVTEYDGGANAALHTWQLAVGTKLVFGLGESFAATDGVPNSDGGYDFTPCHRARASTFGTVAERAADADQPIVFVHLACSAANSSNFFLPQTSQYGGSQVTPQLAVMEHVVTALGQQPDAVMLSTGGNDVPFLAYVLACTPHPKNGTIVLERFCDDSSTDPETVAYDHGLEGELTAALGRLDANLQTVNGCLTAGTGGTVTAGDGSYYGRAPVPHTVDCPLQTTRVTPNKVISVGYPNLLQDQNGDYCQSPTTPDILRGAFVDKPQTAWLGPRLIGGLAQTLSSASSALGWRYVSTKEAFDAHGICADVPYARSLEEAAGDQLQQVVNAVQSGDLSSVQTVFGEVFHPNNLGTGAYGDVTGPALHDVLATSDDRDELHLDRTLADLDCAAGGYVTGRLTFGAGDGRRNAGRSVVIASGRPGGSQAAAIDRSTVTLDTGTGDVPFRLKADGATARIAVYEQDAPAGETAPILTDTIALRPECLPPPPPPGAGPAAFAYGDPHLVTADGVNVNAQVVGEYDYLSPVDPSRNEPALHARQELMSNHGAATYVTAFGAQLAGHHVEVYTRPFGMLLDGAWQNVPITGTYYRDLGPGTSLTLVDQTQITFRSPQMTITASVLHRNTPTAHMSLMVSDLPADGSLAGLLGRPNGNPADDLATRAGEPLTNGSVSVVPSGLWQLTDSWRITTRADSLLSQEDGNLNQPNPTEFPTPEQLAPYVAQIADETGRACSPSPSAQVNAADLATELFHGVELSDIRELYCRYRIEGTVVAGDDAGLGVGGIGVDVTSPQLAGCSTVSQADGHFSCDTGPSLAGVDSGDVPVVTTTTHLIGSTAEQGSTTVTLAAKAPLGGTTSAQVTVPTRARILRLAGTILTAAGRPAPATKVAVTLGALARNLDIDPATGAYQLAMAYPDTAASASIEVSATDVGLIGGGLINANLGPGVTSLTRNFTVLPPVADVGGASYSIVATTGPATGTAILMQPIDEYRYRVVALRPDGSTAWSIEPDIYQPSQLMLSQDGSRVYIVASYDTRAYDLRPDHGGELLWRYDKVSYSAVVGPANTVWFDGVVAGVGDRSLDVIGADGQQLLSHPITVPSGQLYTVNPAVVDPDGGGAVLDYAEYNTRHVVSLKLDGTVRWQRDFAVAYPYSSYNVGTRDMIFLNGYAPGGASGGWSLRRSDGTAGWSNGPSEYNGGDTVNRPVVTVGGQERMLAVVTDGGRYAEARDANSGAVVWRTRLDGPTGVANGYPVTGNPCLVGAIYPGREENRTNTPPDCIVARDGSMYLSLYSSNPPTGHSNFLLVALKPDGTLRYTADVPRTFALRGASQDGRVFYESNLSVAGNHVVPTLTALDATGRTVWSYSHDRSVSPDGFYQVRVVGDTVQFVTDVYSPGPTRHWVVLRP